MAVVYRLANGTLLMVPDTTQVATINPTDLPIKGDERASSDFIADLVKYASPRSKELAHYIDDAAKQIDTRIVMPDMQVSAAAKS